jgi:hypothetical protein
MRFSAIAATALLIMLARPASAIGQEWRPSTATIFEGECSPDIELEARVLARQTPTEIRRIECDKVAFDQDSKVLVFFRNGSQVPEVTLYYQPDHVLQVHNLRFGNQPDAISVGGQCSLVEKNDKTQIRFSCLMLYDTPAHKRTAVIADFVSTPTAAK